MQRNHRLNRAYREITQRRVFEILNKHIRYEPGMGGYRNYREDPHFNWVDDHRL